MGRLKIWDGSAWQLIPDGDTYAITAKNMADLPSTYSPGVTHFNAGSAPNGGADWPAGTTSSVLTFRHPSLVERTVQLNVKKEAGDTYTNENLYIRGIAVGQTDAWGVWKTLDPTTHRAKMTRSNLQGISNNSTTKVAFDSTGYDDGVTTGSNRLNIVRDGYYHVGGNVTWTSNTSGRRVVELQKNSVFLTRTHAAPVGSAHCHEVHWEGFCNAGDYVELYVYQNSGAALDLTDADLYIHSAGRQTSPS